MRFVQELGCYFFFAVPFFGAAFFTAAALPFSCSQMATTALAWPGPVFSMRWARSSACLVRPNLESVREVLPGLAGGSFGIGEVGLEALVKLRAVAGHSRLQI